MVKSFDGAQMELLNWNSGRCSRRPATSIVALLASASTQKLLQRLSLRGSCTLLRLNHFSWFDHSLGNRRLLLLWLDHDCRGLLLLKARWVVCRRKRKSGDSSTAAPCSRYGSRRMTWSVVATYGFTVWLCTHSLMMLSNHGYFVIRIV